MKDNLIEISEATKNFGSGRGIFDLSFILKKHNFCGVIGENGAGKSTLMRSIMGFYKLDSGFISVKGFDSFNNQNEIKKFLSYVPGEVNFPDLKSGIDFINLQCELDESFDKNKANKLINIFQLDISGSPKQMSKGMKQKLSIINALAKNKEICLLDEPSTGLDPLMREIFLEIIDHEKIEGKTILMSSNTFDDIERTCDSLIYLSEGKLVTLIDITNFKKDNFKVCKIKFGDSNQFSREKNLQKFFKVNEQKLELSYVVKQREINQFVNKISFYDVLKFDLDDFSLEEFINFKIGELKNDKK